MIIILPRTSQLLGITLAVLLATSAQASLVQNGSFEDVQINAQFSTNPADIPGWTHAGSAGDLLIARSGPQCCGGTNTALAGDGNQFVTLGGGFGPTGTAAWSQTIAGLTIGQTYTVSFLLAAEGETATQDITVGFADGSDSAPQTFTSLPTNTLFWQNWGVNQYHFVPTATSATLQFSVVNQAFDVGLDGVSITAVPVPAAIWLLGTALGGLGFARRRAA